MDVQYAKQLLEGLADGMNPLTGEVLSKDDVCNDPEIIRALHAILRMLDKEKLSKHLPENAGKPWTKEDDEELCRRFDNGSSIKELSHAFKRTQGSISSRLERLGKVK